MKRFIEKDLIEWKNDPGRMPLVVRGARQVGKSFTITSFGESHFESVVVINFEKQAEYKQCFNSLEPVKILQELELFLHRKIIPGKTLLFFDEIQECPRALIALRYFKEDMPELHVIAAGSLLEFVINDERFSFPVGRVQFLYMRPLSFWEFLEVSERSLLRQHLEKISVGTELNQALHQECLRHIRIYFVTGGMPAVVQKYISTNSFLDCRNLEYGLLQAYRQDFGKYAKHTQHVYLQRLFEKSPDFVGSYVRYSKIDPESSNPARDYKQAIGLLANAGLISRIHATSANGFPLVAEVNEKKFKLLFLDIGLLQSVMEIDPIAFLKEEISLINKGKFAEQFVGQEILAYSDSRRDTKLYFWEREQRGSEAEVDYIFPVGSQILPIEVKASSTGRLKSLRQFMEEKECKIGIKISEAPLQFDGNVLTVPFYLISQIPRFVKYLDQAG